MREGLVGQDEPTVLPVRITAPHIERVVDAPFALN